MKIPGPDHPITIEPTAGTVTIRVGGQVIAESRSALLLRESSYPVVHYLPLSDVDQSRLRETATSTHCPYKGDASYYSIVDRDAPGGELVDAVWSYRAPYPAVAPISGYVAFYPDKVDIAVAPER